ncbi:MAG: 3-deoxy-manno-octulosonate cytidylyltransferase [Rhodobacteraceae bacterium]|nr:3-deoxy-manno-octulosonate cytidylyltransferase [Paracoccaceae bacterium]
MSVTIILPMRYGSRRFPGKALVPLKGADGACKTLIHRCWEAANRVSGITRVVVATDDERIVAEVANFGGESVLTSPDCRNGTERCAETVRILGIKDGFIVNLQGDAPLTPPWFIEDLVKAARGFGQFDLLTPVIQCDAEGHAALMNDRRAGRVGATTVVFDSRQHALYFSKEVIPFTTEASAVYHHVGVYLYTVEALSWYSDQQAGPLELTEGLEQLRFLEFGRRIGCVPVQSRGQTFWELNNPSDISLVEACLRDQSIT